MALPSLWTATRCLQVYVFLHVIYLLGKDSGGKQYLTYVNTIEIHKLILGSSGNRQSTYIT